MDGIPDKSAWKFDPDTGEPISRPDEPVPASPPPPPPAPPPAPAPPTYYAAPDPGQTQYIGSAMQPQYPTEPVAAVEQQSAPQVNVQPRKRGRAGLVVGAIAFVLLAGVVIGGLYLWQNVINRPAVAMEKLLPPTTLGYFSFDPVLEGSQKSAMENLRAAFESQPGFKEAWSSIFEEAAPNLLGTDGNGTPEVSNFDSLAQYLGNNVTVAILPPNTSDLERLKNAAGDGGEGEGRDSIESVASDVLSRNVVGIVDLDFNPLNKKGPIADLKKQADNIGQAELVEKYRDVEIRKFITDTTEIYFALIDGTSTAIVGAKADPLRVLIDNYNGTYSLKDSTTFKELSGQVPAERVAALYINLSEIYREAGLASPELLNAVDVQNASGAMLLTLSAQNDGVQIDIASEASLSMASAGMAQAISVNPNAKPDVRTLADIPAKSTGFVVGTDLKAVIQAVLDNMRANKNVADSMEQQLQDMEQQTGVNLERDVLPLLGGDYFVSFSMEQGQQESGEPAMGGLLEIKLTDSAKASQLLDTFFGTMDGGQSSEKVSLLGGTFYRSATGADGTLIGVANNRFWMVFDSTPQASEARLNAAAGEVGNGLGNTAEWRETAKHLPREANLLGYLDLKQARETLESTFIAGESDRADYDKSIAPFVRPIKYVLFGSASQSAGVSGASRNHTLIFLGISK